jgi:hypothetical protein
MYQWQYRIDKSEDTSKMDTYEAGNDGNLDSHVVNLTLKDQIPVVVESVEYEEEVSTEVENRFQNGSNPTKNTTKIKKIKVPSVAVDFVRTITAHCKRKKIYTSARNKYDNEYGGNLHS